MLLRQRKSKPDYTDFDSDSEADVDDLGEDTASLIAEINGCRLIVRIAVSTDLNSADSPSSVFSIDSDVDCSATVPNAADSLSKSSEDTSSNNSIPYRADKCANQCGRRPIAGISLMSNDSVADLLDISSDILEWQHEDLGSEHLQNYVFAESHVVIADSCDQELLLVTGIMMEGGHIEYNSDASNGPGDPRFHRLGSTFTDHYKNVRNNHKRPSPLSDTGLSFLGRISEVVDIEKGEGMYSHICKTAGLVQQELQKVMGRHTDQSKDDYDGHGNPLTFTGRVCNHSGPNFHFVLTAMFVWSDADGKEHQHMIARAKILMKSPGKYTLSSVGAGRHPVGRAIDPKDGLLKAVVLFHAVELADNEDTMARTLIVRDHKFETKEDELEFMTGTHKNDLDLSEFYSNSTELQNCMRDSEKMKSFLNTCTAEVSVGPESHHVACGREKCSNLATCFLTSGGGREALDTLLANGGDVFDFGRFLVCESCSGDDPAITNLCPACYVRPGLAKNTHCTECKEFRCRGFRPKGGGETSFACKGRSELEIAHKAGVVLNADSRINRVRHENICSECRNAYARANRKAEGRKPIQSYTSKEAIVRFVDIKNDSRYFSSSGKQFKGKALAGEIEGIPGVFVGHTASQIQDIVGSVKLRSKQVTRSDTCDACKCNRCPWVGKKVNDYEKPFRLGGHGFDVVRQLLIHGAEFGKEAQIQGARKARSQDGERRSAKS